MWSVRTSCDRIKFKFEMLEIEESGADYIILSENGNEVTIGLNTTEQKSFDPISRRSK